MQARIDRKLQRQRDSKLPKTFVSCTKKKNNLLPLMEEESGGVAIVLPDEVWVHIFQ